MSPDGDPRLIDTIFNVSSLTSGIFNNSLFQYAGAIIVGIILFGELLLFVLVKLGSKGLVVLKIYGGQNIFDKQITNRKSLFSVSSLYLWNHHH